MLSHNEPFRDLSSFINTTQDNRELKRALAVKIYLSGWTLKETANYLGVSFQYVSKWKELYLRQGVQSLKLNYKGSSGYLTQRERTNTINWIKKQKCCTVQELKSHINEYCGKCFRSQQSYYQLLYEAGFSFKKAQKTNPKQRVSQVYAKRHVLKKDIAESKPRNREKNTLFLL